MAKSEATTQAAKAQTPEEISKELAVLAGQGRVTEARRLVAEATARFPDSEDLQRWAVVLAPPKVTLGERATGSGPEGIREWLAEHTEEYAGHWVALRKGQLVGADPDRVALHRRLEAADDLEDTVWIRL